MLSERWSLLLTLAREDLHFDDRAVDTRRADERSVLNVARLLAEDRAEKFLLGRQLRLALRRDLADEDGAGLDLRADAYDARLVEVAEHVLADVRDVARDLLGAELRVARLYLQLLDVNRRVVVVLHEALGDENRVLEVVAAPRHEGDEHVAAEGQLAAVCAGAVGDDLRLRDALAYLDNRALVDARVLVRALELRQRVDVGSHLARDGAVHVVIRATMTRSEST